MPKFYKQTEVCVETEVDIDDFLNACSSKDIDELVDALIEDGHISEKAKLSYDCYSAAEAYFEEALEKLKGKWNMLTQEEEEIILKIANRF